MAHHASAKKRIRRNAHRFEINHARMGRIRTSLKKVEVAIESGDHSAARDAFKLAMPELMRGRTKGVFHQGDGCISLSSLDVPPATII